MIFAVGQCFIYFSFPFHFCPTSWTPMLSFLLMVEVLYNIMDTNQAYTLWPVQAFTRPKLSHLGAEETIYPLPPLITIGIGKSGILLWDLHSVLFDAAGKWDIRH